LSENAEYHAAKDRQGFVNGWLDQLKKRLAEMPWMAHIGGARLARR